MFVDALDKFKIGVDPRRTHLKRLPKIIWVFGSGPIGIEECHRNSSFRNVFLNWASESKNPLSEQFQLPEYFPEWNNFQGYQNLVDFERDAGALSSAVLLFSEGSGALAELGAFCMDQVLSERLLVVVRKSHFQEDSFLVHGPLKKLVGDNSESSVCVIDSETPEQFYAEAHIVAEILKSKVEDNPKKELISFERVRDKLLLMADLIELFGAITENELLGILDFMGFSMGRADFRKLTSPLKLFGIVKELQQYEKKFLIAPSSNRDSYMDYSGAGESRFDRISFKLTSFEYLKKDATRKKAYEQIHGVIR